MRLAHAQSSDSECQAAVRNQARDEDHDCRGCAHYPWNSDESANPDIEIINAVRPALGTTNGLLACISSPYARRGELWNAFKTEWGDKGDASILVAKGSTRDLNPSYEQSKIDREYERDAAYAAAEYGGEFRTDVEGFLTQDFETCSPTAL